MQGPPQMSVHLDPTHSLWYESMQDMSGYVVLTDTILPQLDEQIDPINSTAQIENDFDVRYQGLPSPAEEYILGDAYEDVLVEESNMFGNSNCETFDPKTDECQTESPFKRNFNFTHSNHTRTITNIGDGERNLQQLSFYRPKVKSISTDKSEKLIEIIDSEEPQIKDPDIMCYTQNKMDFDIKPVDVSDIFSSEETNVTDDMDKVNYSTDFKDMDVAEEVVVTTEAEDEFKISLLEGIPNPEEELDILEEKSKNEDGVVFKQDPFHEDFDTVMDGLFNNLDDIGVAADEIGETSQMSANLAVNHHHLTLDICAARAALLDDKGITGTPELLEALKSEDGKFDLIDYITANMDPNNNAINSPSVLSQKKIESPRTGKSLLSLEDLKQAQTQGRGKPFRRKDGGGEEQEPVPSTSGVSPSGRPPRKSATRFKKMIEEGFLNTTVDSPSLSSDEEDDSPRAKRRRKTSTTSSRRRLNSDSDRSSISEDAMKYRERRDRNNLSSKRSRQKRKLKYVMKQNEMKELEEENARLQQKADEMESVLTRIKSAWAEYLARNKDNDKDRR